jgi:hypothetical protein
MRLAWIRDGREDDYIQLLKSHGQAAFANQIVNQVAASWSNWTQNAATLENAREQWGQRLSTLGLP